MQDNLRKGVPVIGGTQSISDFLVTNVLEPLPRVPRLVAVARGRRGVGCVGWLSKGWRLAVTVAVCLVAIGAMGTIPGGATGVHRCGTSR